ncbi:MAG: hypothetical protein RLZZ292_2748 [Bacteroidota bacterium]|jgi:hypothetical protein
MKKTFYSPIFFFGAIILVLVSCGRLNGKYCGTRSGGFAGYCYTFDQEKHLFKSQYSDCTGVEDKKGTYQRFGSLVVVDLIPYAERETQFVVLNEQTQQQDTIYLPVPFITESTKKGKEYYFVRKVRKNKFSVRKL